MVTEKGTFKFINTKTFVRDYLSPRDATTPSLVRDTGGGRYVLVADPLVQLVVSDKEPAGPARDTPCTAAVKSWVDRGMVPPWL